MADESYPQDLKYFKEHDWVRVEGGEATFGITWWAQDALGDMVYASLPDVGTTVARGSPTASSSRSSRWPRSTPRWAARSWPPTTLCVADPALVNADPYGQGWLIRVRLSDAVPSSTASWTPPPTRSSSHGEAS